MNRLNEAHGLLSTLLNTFATEQSLPVKWEGVIEEPSTPTYLREWLIPGSFDAASLGPTAPNTGPLIYQVDIVTKIGNWGIPYNISSTFFTTYFYRGRVLANDEATTRLTITRGQTGPLMRGDTRLVLPMSITLRTYMSL